MSYFDSKSKGLHFSSLCSHLVSEIVAQLLPPPSVSQSNRDRSLCIRLTNNIFIQLIDNLLWLEHILETGCEHRRDGNVLLTKGRSVTVERVSWRLITY